MNIKIEVLKDELEEDRGKKSWPVGKGLKVEGRAAVRDSARRNRP